MFWIWFWHLVAVVAVFAFGGLPSLYLKRMVERFETHRPLTAAEVVRVVVAGREVDGEARAAFIAAFNQAVFLRRCTMTPDWRPQVVAETASGGEITLSTRSHDIRSHDIVIARSRRGKPVVYQVYAPALADWLQAHGAVQAG
ncbi:hypothetical protein GCM10010885_13000 [Alicyclobacillus cellulosilyticus]|uniref:Uncharacterized protein n=1 Tax=Alicyclobacillus cellulosilyticus TaxID=1003997 RepID=A0A917K9I2_9BACL|nr:YfmQ family protein [Alicyclobacillus cellulosilyticus]GGJ05327.1 hypothetical protein GCM10010885_13000 [Alicyclobacillus cellulosilyticus]